MRGKIIGGADHRDIEFSPLQALQFIERQLHVRQLLGDAAAVMIKFVSRIGQIDFLAHLFKQRQADVVLQLLDLHRNRWLGQIEALPRRARNSGGGQPIQKLLIA